MMSMLKSYFLYANGDYERPPFPSEWKMILDGLQEEQRKRKRSTSPLRNERVARLRMEDGRKLKLSIGGRGYGCEVGPSSSQNGVAARQNGRRCTSRSHLHGQTPSRPASSLSTQHPPPCDPQMQRTYEEYQQQSLMQQTEMQEPQQHQQTQ